MPIVLIHRHEMILGVGCLVTKQRPAGAPKTQVVSQKGSVCVRIPKELCEARILKELCEALREERIEIKMSCFIGQSTLDKCIALRLVYSC